MRKTKAPITVDIKLKEMRNIKFNKDLFVPMKTKTIVDSILSDEGGIFPGTNTVVIGDPGVGKSTVLLDWIADLSASGKKVLDSWAEVTSVVQDQKGWARKKTESWLLDLLEKNNKAENQANKNTAFICIQQMTKQGEFAGSNRIKHMTTAMAHLRFDGSGRDAERYIEFSKNRRGMVGEKIYFDLHRGECVDYSFENIS